MQLRRWWLPLLLYPIAGFAADPVLLRTTLIVHDIDRSIAFYKELGFTVAGDRSGPRPPDAPFPLASAATRFRLAVLGSRSGEGGAIGLLEFEAPAPPVTDPPRDRLGAGDVVFVVQVPDAAMAYASLKAVGARFVEGEPLAYEVPNETGTISRGAMFHVFDPDGRLVEVLSSRTVDAPRAAQ